MQTVMDEGFIRYNIDGTVKESLNFLPALQAQTISEFVAEKTACFMYWGAGIMHCGAWPYGGTAKIIWLPHSKK